MSLLSVLHSWLGRRRSQMTPDPTFLLAPGRESTVRSRRRVLANSRGGGGRMIFTITLPRLSFAQDPGQMLAIGDRIRMLRPKSVLTDPDCPLAKGLRLCITTLGKGEFGQVVKSFSGRGMLGSKHLFNDREGLLPQRLGLLIVSLLII